MDIKMDASYYKISFLIKFIYITEVINPMNPPQNNIECPCKIAI